MTRAAGNGGPTTAAIESGAISSIIGNVLSNATGTIVAGATSVTVVGNSGFSGYSGGTQAGNI